MTRHARAFLRRLRESWCSDNDLDALAEAAAELLAPAEALVFEARPSDGALRIASTFAVPNVDVDPPERHLAVLLYQLPANRCVLDSELDTVTRQRLQAVGRHVGGPERWHGLCATAHQEGRPLMGLLLLRPAGARPFGRREAGRLDALLPAISECRAARLTLETSPVGARALGLLLDAHPGPAFLVSNGTVLYANPDARRLEWDGVGPPCPGLLRAFPLGNAGLTLLLPAPRSADDAHGLPPWLSRVADLVARGRSDKEIATELGMAHATARTAVTRILKRFGLTSRRQLMRLWRTPEDR